MLEQVPDKLLLQELSAGGKLTGPDGSDLPESDVIKLLAGARERQRQKVFMKQMRGVQVFNQAIVVPIDGVDTSRSPTSKQGPNTPLPDFLLPVQKRANREKPTSNNSEILGGNFGRFFSIHSCVFAVVFVVKMKASLGRQTAFEIKAGFKETQDSVQNMRFEAINHTWIKTAKPTTSVNDPSAASSTTFPTVAGMSKLLVSTPIRSTTL